MQDCTAIYYEGDFKQRINIQKKLENEMIKRFGRNKPNDFKYKILYEDNCVYAEHVSERRLMNN